MFQKNLYKAFIARCAPLGALSSILLLLNACCGDYHPTRYPVNLIENYTGEAIQTPSNNNSVVLVGGCFDILHFGHIEFLEKAKASGDYLKKAKAHDDYLIVALEPDDSIINYKHNKPIHSQKERAKILTALRVVDMVVLLPVLKGFADYNQLVANIRPDVIAVTADDPQLENKRKQASAVGATVKIVTPRLADFSSSAIRQAKA